MKFKKLINAIGCAIMLSGSTMVLSGCTNSNSGDIVSSISESVAKDLNFYDSNGTSLLTQKIELSDAGKPSMEIANPDILNNDNGILTNLLSADNKAKNNEDAKFLSGVGFNSGSTTAAYSPDEILAISKIYISYDPLQFSGGKIISDTDQNDFKVSSTTVIIQILQGDASTPILNLKVNVSESYLSIRRDVVSTINIDKNSWNLAGFFNVGQTAKDTIVMLKINFNADQLTRLNYICNFVLPGFDLSYFIFSMKDPFNPEFITDNDKLETNVPYTLTLRLGTIQLTLPIDLGKPTS